MKRREEASVASAVRMVWNWEDSLVFVRMVLWDMDRVAAVDPVELDVDVDVDVEVRDVSRRRSILVCDDLILVRYIRPKRQSTVRYSNEIDLICMYEIKGRTQTSTVPDIIRCLLSFVRTA